MLRLEGVSVAYGKHEALHEVSLSVTAGETTAILGTNGAGRLNIKLGWRESLSAPSLA